MSRYVAIAGDRSDITSAIPDGSSILSISVTPALHIVVSHSSLLLLLSRERFVSVPRWLVYYLGHGSAQSKRSAPRVLAIQPV